MLSSKALANALRVLSMDGVQKANSGHPGAPMGLADIAQVVWCEFLSHAPLHPNWPNRDRFILSNGHASMLLYALLHLSGYPLSIEDIQQFRQLHSKTPGHPEFGLTEGVETTTGPLGQGLANAVGMALAERSLAATFNRPGFDLIDHYTYVTVGDGCLMEGISHEVCSFAGTQQLGKLIVFWDDNGISIDGEVKAWFSEDVIKRFEAYGWQVIPAVDGHDAKAIREAILEAKSEHARPSLIACKTQIGKGSPNKVNTADVHGAPLGADEVALARAALDWPYPPFEIPEAYYQGYDARERGEQAYKKWQKQFEAYREHHPELAAEFERRVAGRLPLAWDGLKQEVLIASQEKKENIATRKASLQVLNAFGPHLPELLGGSADLTHSNLTYWKGCEAISPLHPAGNYIYYGVREFGMSAMMNGIALYGGFIPYGGTFLTFVDYARNAVRMAALMKQKVIFVYTHDSIGLGEDGPTHQPIEQHAMLRLTPGLQVWRPCDATETVVAWAKAIEQDGPSCLLLSRQNLPAQARSAKQLEQIQRGAYVLFETEQVAECVIIATGSEVALAMSVAKRLEAKGKGLRVVSMPCVETFMTQSEDYQREVLPEHLEKRVAIEAGAKDYWYKFVGLKGKIFALDRFGESAPAELVYKALGLSEETILNEIIEWI